MSDDTPEAKFDDEDDEGMEPLPLAARGRSYRNLTILGGCFLILGVVVLVAAVPLARGPAPLAKEAETFESEPIEWDVFNYNYSGSNRCPRSTVYPSHTGCPQTCVRPDGAELSERLYYFTVVFYFGQSAAYNDTLPPKQSAYKHGINFQCPLALVRNFVNSGQKYVSRFTSNYTDSSSSSVILVDKLHTTLSYICCLTKDEAYWAQQLAKQWVMDSYPFDFQMGFNRVECVTPRPNAWGTMLVADASTQHTLLAMNHQIRDLLIAHDIPVIVPREQQYPFHISLASVILEDVDLTTNKTNNTNKGTQQEDMEDQLGRQIQEFSDTISHKYGSSWTGGVDGKMTVRHWPRVNDLTQHLSD